MDGHVLISTCAGSRFASYEPPVGKSETLQPHCWQAFVRRTWLRNSQPPVATFSQKCISPWGLPHQIAAAPAQLLVVLLQGHSYTWEAGDGEAGPPCGAGGQEPQPCTIQCLLPSNHWARKEPISARVKGIVPGSSGTHRFFFCTYITCNRDMVLWGGEHCPVSRPTSTPLITVEMLWPPNQAHRAAAPGKSEDSLPRPPPPRPG